jgi:hypothetical protein
MNWNLLQIMSEMRNMSEMRGKMPTSWEVSSAFVSNGMLELDDNGNPPTEILGLPVVYSYSESTMLIRLNNHTRRGVVALYDSNHDFTNS